jgi:hypothetical protein
LRAELDSGSIEAAYQFLLRSSQVDSLAIYKKLKVTGYSETARTLIIVSNDDVIVSKIKRSLFRIPETESTLQPMNRDGIAFAIGINAFMIVAARLTGIPVVLRGVIVRIVPMVLSVGIVRQDGGPSNQTNSQCYSQT